MKWGDLKDEDQTSETKRNQHSQKVNDLILKIKKKDQTRDYETDLI